jgi:hypothetical protein
VTLVHYDRDYERIAAASEVRQEWLAPEEPWLKGRNGPISPIPAEPAMEGRGEKN